ncbi:Slx4p interacting protein [Ceratobasidium sp. 414]|nr:Slx4p interacting protein [Ceratobasidium sp. 414]
MALYNTWPLHVKIFTEEAKRLWDEAQQPGLDTPLPRGFTYSIEYEGVDGKSPIPTGQGSVTRAGPIDIKDRYSLVMFAVLQRHEQKTNSWCLSESFRGGPPKLTTPLIPRGGVCDECNKYVLWGDVIRGCYRRARGGLEQPASEHEIEDDDEEEDRSEVSDDLGEQLDGFRIGKQLATQPQPQNLAAPNTELANQPKPTKRPKPRAPTKSKPRPKKALQNARGDPVSDVEDFAAEMDAIQCDTEGEDAPSPNPPPKPTKMKRTFKIQKPNTKPLKAKVPEPSGNNSGLDDLDRALGGLSLLSKGVSVSASKVPKATASRSKPPPAKAAKIPRPTKTKRAEGVDIFDDEQWKASAVAPPKPLPSRGPARVRSPSPDYIDIWGV